MAIVKTSMGTNEANAMISMLGLTFALKFGMLTLALLLFGKLLFDLFRLALQLRKYFKQRRKENFRNFLNEAIDEAFNSDQVPLLDEGHLNVESKIVGFVQPGKTEKSQPQ